MIKERKKKKKKKYRNIIIKLCEMMGISYAVSVYDIESSIKLFTIHLTNECIFTAKYV